MLEPKFYRYCLTQEQVSEYKAIFDKWVVKSARKLGQRKTIDFGQFSAFMKHLGFSISEAELRGNLDSLGIDNARLGFSEIVRVIGRRSLDEELEQEIKRVFDFFDTNQDGKINAPELKKGLGLLRQKVSNEDIDRIVLENDLDGDGYINYEEFLILMLCR